MAQGEGAQTGSEDVPTTSMRSEQDLMVGQYQGSVIDLVYYTS